MMSLREVKTLMEEPDMSDKEAEEVRTFCYALAELLLDIWKEENIESPPPPDLTAGYPHELNQKP